MITLTKPFFTFNQNMLLLIWLAVLASALYQFFKQTYSRYKNTDVKCPSVVPLCGTIARILMKKEHVVYFFERLHNTYEGERFYGQYEFMRPIVVIRDIELLKLVTVKEFDSFLDRKTIADGKVDPIFGRNLVMLKGQEWKDMRSSLSPAFTGSKIKLMIPMMVEAGNEMTQTLKKKILNTNHKFVDLESKDFTTSYASDVIASCVFGLKVSSSTEKDIFLKMAKEVTDLKSTMLLKIFLFVHFPALTKLLNIQFLPRVVSRFFTNIVLNTMSDREIHNIVRPDMIHLLLEAKKGKLQHDINTAKDSNAGYATVEESSVGKTNSKTDWSDNDLVAQAAVFLLGGFDTISTAMSFAIHELALNPEVQERLAAEIQENDRKNNGKFDYNSVQEMVYMDMVVSEVLRKWPPSAVSDRHCTKDYNLGPPNKKSNKDYYIRKGESIVIPVWAFHRDPKYFPNPTKFDPERFSEENKHKIVPCSYIPFGMGPRNCIGSRFALCEVKVMLYQLLQHFQLSPCEKTCIHVQLDTDSFNFKIKGGHWVRLRIRE